MTNEEIFKYADKALKKQEDRILLATWLPLVMGLFGLSMLFFVVDNLEYSVFKTIYVLCEILIGGLMFILVGINWNKWFKIRRNYIYNLVRKDERKRIEGK